MALRKIIWRIQKIWNGGKINLGSYAEILELERRIKILDD